MDLKREKRLNYIAVLSGDIQRTVYWLLNERLKNLQVADITVNVSNRTIYTQNNVYVVCCTKEHIYGYQWDDWFKAPDYESLEDILRNRVGR